MAMNTVSLVMICKNEIKNAAILLAQVLPVLEEVVVVDTGSTDGTLQLLQELTQIHTNLRLYQFDWIEDFSAARNYSFTHATKDWIFWLDLDDQIDPVQLKSFKDNELDNPDVDCWLLDYIYSRYPDGTPQSTLGRERFIRRASRPRFYGAIHECIDISCMRQRHFDGLKVVHHRDGKVIDYGRNIRILTAEYEKKKNDPRTAYYFGKELFDHMDPRSTEVLERYLTLPGRYYDDEVNARFRLAKQYLHQKKHRDALRQAEEIYHLDSTRDRAEGYFIFGEVEKDLKNYRVAIKWYERCLVTPPPPPRVLSLEYYGWHPLKRIAECYGEQRKYAQMFDYATRVKQLLPNDAGIVHWYNDMQRLVLSPRHGLVVVEERHEFADWLRSDSYKVGPGQEMDVDVERMPFATASLDGMVIGSFGSLADVARVIKPKGFLWAPWHLDEKQIDFVCVGTAVYKGRTVYNYIRIDESLQSLSFASGDLNFGPYRIRIENLRKSAAKAGHRIVQKDADIYIAPSLPEKRGKINVLDICEKLPGYSFAHPENADVINCSSDILKQHLMSMFPGKPVIAIDDHFEMTLEEWL